MKTKSVLMTVMLLASVAAYSSAQQQSVATRPPVKGEQPFIVKTVSLHHLTSMEAVRLLSPYVQNPGGGVYEVSSNIRAVTIREVQAALRLRPDSVEAQTQLAVLLKAKSARDRAR